MNLYIYTLSSYLKPYMLKGFLFIWLMLTTPTVETDEVDPNTEKYTLKENKTDIPAETLWDNPGFRLQLGLGYHQGHVQVLDEPTRGFGFMVQPAYHFGRYLTTSITLGYEVLMNEVTGIRWFSTADIGWKIWRGLQISLGLGFGGLMSKCKSDACYDRMMNYAYNKLEPIVDCNNSGLALSAELSYLFVVGPTFSTGPVIYTDWQFTTCEEGIGLHDPETGREVTQKEDWTHFSIFSGWWLAWR